MIRNILLATSAIALMSCKNYYTVTENELNSASNREAARFQKEHPLVLKYNGGEVRYTLENVSVDLMSAEGGKVAFKTHGKLNASVNLFGQKISKTLQISPAFVAGLTYTEGEFFLKNPRLDLSSINPRTPIEQKIYSSLDQLASKIEQIPLYRLENSVKEKIGAKVINNIEVTDSELRFM